MDWHSSPALAIRVLSVSVVYLSVLLGLLMIDSAVWRGVDLAGRVGLRRPGGLRAAGGAGRGTVAHRQQPGRPAHADDQRPADYRGRHPGRRAVPRPKRGELLAGLSLPAAVLLATIWQQKTWVMTSPGLGITPQLLVLMAMTIAVHLAFGQYVQARGSGRRMPAASVLLTVAGIALVAAAANFRAFWVHDLFHLAGVVVWLAGMPALIVSMRCQEARLAHGQGGPGAKPTQQA